MKKITILAAAALLAGAAQAATLDFTVTLNVTSLMGSAPFGLEVNFVDTQAQNGTSSVSLSNFVVTGGAFTGSSTPKGLASGDFIAGASLQADSSTPLSSVVQDLDMAPTSLSFNVSVTSDLNPLVAHGLQFYFYDKDNFLDTNDGDRNAYINLAVNNDMTFDSIETFTGSGITASVTAIPEPSTYGLIGAGALAAVAGIRRRRKVA